MSSCRPALAMLLALNTAGVFAAEILRSDFEQGAELAKYAGLSIRGAQAAIVAGGPAGKGHCLRLRNAKPSPYCSLHLIGPIRVQKNLVLSFWHRAEIEEGFEGAYLGMIFYVDGKQWFWQADAFSHEWRLAQVEIPKLRSSSGHKMRAGLVLSGIQLYGRVKEKTKVKGETKARMTVWFDDIRLYTGHRQRTLAERTRVSTANPPLFHWTKLDGEGDQKLQYSLDSQFPAAASRAVAVEHNFHTPPAPLAPGTWYWRVWSSGELYDGWSAIARTIVVPEAHRFATAAAPNARLAKEPRPRLRKLARVDEPPLTPERKARLVRSARAIHRRGVPEHPGPHTPGDPRWPTWIDWYGKVAGRITGGTGRRLERVARSAILTGDAQTILWAKELALEACKWDPDGGSAMRRGDIGAHHLLRGLCWCYDACRDHMTPDERETLKRTIIARTEQFYRRLNPFRGHEANNHAWLQTYGVALAGIVLAGEHEPAAEWVEFARQLYLGRFLCCMGYQGDNNEGIAYWGYGLMFIVEYADMMKAVCGIDLYQHPWLRQTARFPMYCAPPGAWAVSFADTGMPNHGVRGPAQTARVRALALRTHDPYALWYSGQREAVNGIVPRPPSDLPPSIHYRHIGWAIFNTSLVDGREGVTVAMHSGPYFAGHQHPDQNGFVIHAYGEKLAIDGGYYDWYGSPHFKAYSMTTLAHNTLLVNGKGQAVRKKGADGRITAFFDAPGYGYTVGDASAHDIYGGQLEQFDRRILFIKPRFVILHDLVAASAPAQLQWMLHTVEPIQLGEGRTFTVACTNAALHGRFLSPAGARLSITTGFPVEPVNRYSTAPVPRDRYVPEWHLNATPPRSAAAEFFVSMQIRRRGEKGEAQARMVPIPAEGAHAVRLVLPDAAHIAVSRKRRAEGVLRAATLETDGAMAAIELDARGTPRRAFVARATFLRYNGRLLFESKTAQDWAMPER